jgi:hypothetical protein
MIRRFNDDDDDVILKIIMMIMNYVIVKYSIKLIMFNNVNCQ